MRMKKKKILKILGVIILIAVIAAAVLFILMIRNPGMFLKFGAKELSTEQATEISFVYNYDDPSKTQTIPFYCFTPSESGNYIFTITNIESNTEALVSMSAVDRNLDEYFTADNRARASGGPKNEISESIPLQESRDCFVLIFAQPLKDDDIEELSGSFVLTIEKDTSEEGPQSLSVGESVTLKVKAEGQSCASFIPPETGYYKFENSIVSKDSSTGFSTLSAVSSSDELGVGITNEICMLQEGKEYYVWVAVNETNRKVSKVKLSCSHLKTEQATGICYLDINEATVIEYTADSDFNLAVYTVSKGDPGILIYERPGFPLRTDDRSEASLSDNPEDVAAVLSVEKGTKLRICVYGDISDCRVFMTGYTGDGTTLSMDDLVPVPEKKAETDTDTDTDEVQKNDSNNE